MIRASALAALRICAFLSLVFAAAMLFTALVDLAYDGRSAAAFVISAAGVGIVASAVILALRDVRPAFTPRLGIFVVAFAWLALSAVGAIPLVLALPRLGLVDALFESVSGLTTTGSTVITGLEYAPRGVLLWRAMLHWIGGVGIVGMGLILLPFLKIGGLPLDRLESSALRDDAVLRFRRYGQSLMLVYGILSAACVLTYGALGMGAFDAVCHMMATVATGGFGTSDANFGKFADNVPLVWAAVFFMTLSSLPFPVFVAALALGGAGKLRERQVRPFLIIVILLTLGIFFARWAQTGEASVATFRSAVFHLMSIISTTGFTTEDYQNWGPGAVTLVFVATLIGGCGGSTSGGIKTHRLISLAQATRSHLDRLVYPHGLFADGGPARAETSAAFVVLVATAASLAAVTIALAMTGEDLLTSFSAAATALGNVGPGLGPKIGPVGNFAGVNDVAIVLLSLAMLLGRLEYVALLVLLSPRFWRS